VFFKKVNGLGDVRVAGKFNPGSESYAVKIINFLPGVIDALVRNAFITPYDEKKAL